MKRIIYKLIFCLSVLSFASCVSEEVGQEVTDTGTITLELYTGAGASRAEGDLIADELHEYALSHLDIFIFNEDKSKFHYERIATTDAPTGTVTLSGKKKGDFTANAVYWVYVVANSSKTGKDMSSVASLDELKALTQTDTNIHLSGLDLPNVPQYFLMDGIAYIGGTEPTTAGTVEINDGTAAGTTVLKVNLRRAAAKVELVLSAGTNVEFYRNEYVGYYLRNLPTVTTLLADATLGANTQKLVTTAKTVSDYSNGKYKGLEYEGVVYNGNGELSIVAYVYAHSWGATEQEFLAGGTSLVVNVPLKYDTDWTDNVEPVEHDQSYYQIELGKDHKFERNHYYKITGTINAPGAEEYTEPITLTNMKYSAIDWTQVDVNVGGEEKPHYLKVNKDILRIYNQSVDESLIFASSSPITITVHGEVEESNGQLVGSGKPYYYNKYAVKTELNNGNSDFTYWETNSTNSNKGNGVNISAASKEGALNGNVTVNSTKPNNKTIRYFSLLIRNEDGDEVEVQVEQYPVIYVTNQLGWYSYRSDFGTSYEEKGNNGYVGVSLDGSSSGSFWNQTWSWNGGYKYHTNSSGFWYSKVQTNENVTGNNMEIESYYWQGNNVKTQRSNVGTHNARIYHITVTATSGAYTIGRPRMTTENGLTYTAPSDDNAKLVSPSFMIASRLGVVTSNGGNLDEVDDDDRLVIFRNHCANYVEVVKGTNGADNIVYDDWRLPTEAELKIIMDYQGTSGQNADAIDYLLNAGYYFGAAGPVWNSKNDSDIKEGQSSTSKSVRCVRDAY